MTPFDIHFVHIFRQITPLRNYLEAHLNKGQKLALVPTMGALHAGHIELVKQAKATCDIVVCSIFVNPKQFNNTEDLDKYPRPIAADLKMLEEANCEVAFCPDFEEIYGDESYVDFKFGLLEAPMEGAFRPGHFSGVGLIVSKLFNIVQPTDTFFGQKDFQQVTIIKRLIKDLSYQIRLHVVPTKREIDGLAMSSRNGRLDAYQRHEAVALFQALQEAQKLYWDGKQPLEIQTKIIASFKNHKSIQLEYFELVDMATLAPIEQFNGPFVCCIAAHLGPVRLIDNMIVNES